MDPNLAIAAIVLLALMTLGIGALVFLAHKKLQQTVQLQSILRKTSSEVSATGRQVADTFLKADGSFKEMIDSFKDIENLQEIKQRVELITTHLVDMHGKIGSQLDTSGRIIADLHRLIVSWSEEGSQLQRSYQELAQALERALVHDLQQRTELDTKLETLIQDQASSRR